MSVFQKQQFSVFPFSDLTAEWWQSSRSRPSPTSRDCRIATCWGTTPRTVPSSSCTSSAPCPFARWVATRTVNVDGRGPHDAGWAGGGPRAWWRRAVRPGCAGGRALWACGVHSAAFLGLAPPASFSCCGTGGACLLLRGLSGALRSPASHLTLQGVVLGRGGAVRPHTATAPSRPRSSAPQPLPHPSSMQLPEGSQVKTESGRPLPFLLHYTPAPFVTSGTVWRF